jgi:hypothetical protein
MPGGETAASASLTTMALPGSDPPLEMAARTCPIRFWLVRMVLHPVGRYCVRGDDGGTFFPPVQVTPRNEAELKHRYIVGPGLWLKAPGSS